MIAGETARTTCEIDGLRARRRLGRMMRDGAPTTTAGKTALTTWDVDGR
jgi:hypothetical protein